jgi:DNA-binding NarL/FixJ family response regulator
MVSEVIVRVFLLIENRLLQETLTRLFRKRSDLLVVGHGSPSDTQLGPANDTHFDILVMDRLPSASPFASSYGALEPDSDTRRLILIAMEEDEAQFLAAVRCGVAGYLLKDASAGDVVSAVRSVAQGETVCPPRLCKSLFRVAREAPENLRPTVPKPSLTIRQRQLVSLVAKGLTNKEIASHLHLSEFTVKNHLHRIMKQVDAGSRHEAVDTIFSFRGMPSL